MRQYRFRALITLDAAVREGPAQGLPSRMRALTAHYCCLLEPFCYRVYLPAVISPDRGLPLQPGRRVVVTIALADGVVDRTIRPEGLVGYGVICARQSPPLLSNDSGGIRRKTAVPGAVSRRKPDVRPAMPAR